MKRRSINIETIIARICENGDQIAFRELFDCYYPRLLHFSFSLIRNSVLAEEIVLDVFTTIWKNRQKLCEVEHIENYLFKATKNRTLNAVRDKKKDLVHIEVDSIDFKYIRTNQNPESDLLSQELYEKINEAIDALPEKGRIIYRMVKEDGLNYKQVAELLDISTKTVDSHLYSAVKKIRISIEDYYESRGEQSSGMSILEVFILVLPTIEWSGSQYF